MKSETVGDPHCYVYTLGVGIRVIGECRPVVRETSVSRPLFGLESPLTPLLIPPFRLTDPKTQSLRGRLRVETLWKLRRRRGKEGDWEG